VTVTVTRPLYISSAQRFPEARRLTPEDLEALKMFNELANDPELRLDMTFMPGDVQFLHNHTILHALPMRTGRRSNASGTCCVCGFRRRAPAQCRRSSLNATAA
jgi:hypothetical protein